MTSKTGSPRFDEDSVRTRLEERGLQGDALEHALTEILAAADYYGSNDNAGALRILDDANDGDPDGDQILTATDAWLVTARRTEGATSLSGTTIRQESIAGWVSASNLNMYDLEHAFEGQSRIGSLTAPEQTFLVHSYVGNASHHALVSDGGSDIHSNQWLQELFALKTMEFPPNLEATLIDAMTAQAVSVEMRHGNNEQGGTVAAALSTSVIVLLGPEGAADLVDGMAPMTAELFASSLNLDQAPEDLILDSVDHRAGLADGVLRVFIERAGEGGEFSESATGFSFMLLSTSPFSAYFDAGGSSEYATSLSQAIAIAANPNDADTQAFHIERLGDIFTEPEALRLLVADSDDVDPGTRVQLVNTTVLGRTESTSYYAPLDYWTAEDFRTDSEGISLDVMVDVARRTHFDLHGTYPSEQFEAELRAIGRTEEGQDLLGLNSDTSFGLRSQRCPGD